MILLLYGYPCSGKTTLATALSSADNTIMLDGDTFRGTCNKDLGFTEEDRSENLRRVGSVAKMISDQGTDVICSFVAPKEHLRETFREACGGGSLHLFINTPLEVCESRDTKGMYARARAGTLPFFTGIGSSLDISEDDIHILMDDLGRQVRTIGCIVEDYFNNT